MRQLPRTQRRIARASWARAAVCATVCLLGGAAPAGAVDSDGDGLSDYDELNVHGTNPLDVDSDGDGFDDWREVQFGSVPTDADSTPPARPAGFGPALFQASFVIHAFGNDVTTGSVYPFDTDVFVALPLGRDCGGWWSRNNPCGAATLQQGAPATRAGLLGIRGSSPASLWLSTSAFFATQTGDPPWRYYQFITRHGYATFANAAGSFFAGGGPKGRRHTAMDPLAGTWIIHNGAHGFGGTLGLLGRLAGWTRFQTWTSSTHTRQVTWNMIRALGRSAMDTQNPYTYSGWTWTPEAPGPTREVYRSINRGSGAPWTTGSVTVYGRTASFTTALHRAGYDNRTPMGYGTLQLVTPALTHWRLPWPIRGDTGHIGILTIRVPEPGRWVLLAAGLGLLLVLRRWSLRR